MNFSWQEGNRLLLLENGEAFFPQAGNDFLNVKQFSDNALIFALFHHPFVTKTTL